MSLDEIKEKYDSHEYNAELLLKHMIGHSDKLEQSERKINELNSQIRLLKSFIAGLVDKSDNVCCTLEHPTESVNALQMWELRDAISLVESTVPYWG